MGARQKLDGLITDEINRCREHAVLPVLLKLSRARQAQMARHPAGLDRLIDMHIATRAEFIAKADRLPQVAK